MRPQSADQDFQQFGCVCIVLNQHDRHLLDSCGLLHGVPVTKHGFYGVRSHASLTANGFPGAAHTCIDPLLNGVKCDTKECSGLRCRQ